MTKTDENSTEINKKKLCHIAKALSKGTNSMDFFEFQQAVGTLKKLIVHESSRIATATDEMAKRWAELAKNEPPSFAELRRLPDVMLAFMRQWTNELGYIYKAAANNGRDPNGRKKQG